MPPSLLQVLGATLKAALSMLSAALADTLSDKVCGVHSFLRTVPVFTVTPPVQHCVYVFLAPTHFIGYLCLNPQEEETLEATLEMVSMVIDVSIQVRDMLCVHRPVCALSGVCTLWCLHCPVCAPSGVCTVRCVHPLVCALSSVCTLWCVHCPVCAPSGVCTVRCVHCPVCAPSGVCTLWCVHCLVCALSGVCTLWCVHRPVYALSSVC